jgi:hypothetical protein
MTASSAKYLRDLLFEITEARATKLLIAVSSSPNRESSLRAEISGMLAPTGTHLVDIPASELLGSMLATLSNRRDLDSSTGLSISNVAALEGSDIDHFFAELNFHRDWLAKLNLPIILWVPTNLLDRLIATAPDFWSRRSGVYYFDRGSISELLKKLFSRSDEDETEWTPEPTLSKAFQKILSCEKELGRCLRDKKSFSLGKVDDVIREIQSGISQLIEECQKGKQIEVALWLWNFSQLDLKLQRMLDSLEPEMRNRFDSLYTDRNEALLHLSERMVTILKDYLKELEEKIRQKKQVNLVARARMVAAIEINRMAEALASTKELSISEIEEEDSPITALSHVTPEEEIEHEFLARSADELEAWLAGFSYKYPEFFSKQEAELLKLLYTSRLGANELASRMGTSRQTVLRQIHSLERKLRLYLGLPELISKTAKS